jgi:excisionase family DNA binding protein
MKSHENQFGARENTASSRQHVPRLEPSLELSEPSEVSERLQEDHKNVRLSTLTRNHRDPSALERHRATVERERPSHESSAREQIQFNGPAPLSCETEECLVDVREAARHLAVSVSTLYGWVWQRRISFVKVGRAVRFDMADIKKFVREHRVQARSFDKV